MADATPAQLTGAQNLLVIASTWGEGDPPQVELTHDWEHQEAYTVGRNFGHVAYEVDDIYAACQRFIAAGYPISRPPRDGRMAFIRTPDNISIELLQSGAALTPAEPWLSMANTGVW